MRASKIHSRGETKERENSKEKGRKMLPSRKREKNYHAKTIQRKGTMKIIVRNFILG